ncbi:MAG: hypothetical protein JSV66_13585 [Trueperaceae bacterium]|nr:MAG: hypothetical protein JSV66_13585 [Trueperaceae bacterium]
MKKPLQKFGTTRYKLKLFTCWLLLLTGLGTALAYDGFSLGIFGSTSVGGSAVLNARAVYPLSELPIPGEPLQLSVRADVSQALTSGSLPAIAASVLLSGRDPIDPTIETYLGLGTGLSFVPSPLQGPLVSFQLFTGARVPLAERLHGVVELNLSGSGTDFLAPSIGLGLEYRLGGSQ